MQNVYTVAQVNAYIKNMFTQDFMLQSIAVKGEVSNCKYHSSGHIYFTLKDTKGAITCVMFAGNRSGLNFKMAEGQQVIVKGNIDVYERDGKYQLYARSISLDGTGVLYERYEQLKRELEEMGMFDASYKKPIPKYIKTLGVVTAPTGAAVQDIINITTRRNPYVQIILYPAIVQGVQAVPSIVNGIHALEQMGVDVMIVGRGGGSLEDLWAFNEAAVAQAIFDCSVPIISAVGHETDTTIADFVADMRAPTPSAAAELAVYEVDRLLDKIEEDKQILKNTMMRKISNLRNQTGHLSSSLGYLNPMHQLRVKRTYMVDLEEKLQEKMERKINEAKHMLQIDIERLKGLSPLDKLNQGFSFTEDESGKPLTDIGRVKSGDLMRTYVKNGVIESTVTSAYKKDE